MSLSPSWIFARKINGTCCRNSNEINEQKDILIYNILVYRIKFLYIYKKTKRMKKLITLILLLSFGIKTQDVAKSRKPDEINDERD